MRDVTNPEGRSQLVLTCVGSDCKRRKTKAKDEGEAIIDRRRISVEGNGEAMWKYCAQIILSSLKLETTALNNLCRSVADLSCAGVDVLCRSKLHDPNRLTPREGAKIVPVAAWCIV